MLQTTPTDQAALARRPDTAGPLAVATPTTRKLADASISVNTRRAYAGALRRLDAWRGSAPVDDASLAVYLGELFEAGRAPDGAATDRVVGLSPLQIQRRFTAAARAAGIEARVTAHSGRVGLASELTARGAPSRDGRRRLRSRRC